MPEVCAGMRVRGVRPTRNDAGARGSLPALLKARWRESDGSLAQHAAPKPEACPTA